MSETGYVKSRGADLYYEIDGAGEAMVLLHAGVADHRQWNATVETFTGSHRVLRYDQRGFGRSEPVAGEFRAIEDLEAVIAAQGFTGPAVMIGCSMGGSLAMDYTIAHPGLVSALVMVCSSPSGLRLDVPEPEIFREVEKAETAGDFDQVCVLETHIWFDGLSRSAGEVDAPARALLYNMNRTALEHGMRELGERQFDLQPAAYKRLSEVGVPVLVITGSLDLPYTLAAADFMCDGLANVQRVDMATAHLPNMEQPGEFNDAVRAFLVENGLG